METTTMIRTSGSIDVIISRISPQCKVDAPDNNLSCRAAAAPETSTPAIEKTDFASSGTCLEFWSPAIKLLDEQDRHVVQPAKPTFENANLLRPIGATSKAITLNKTISSNRSSITSISPVVDSSPKAGDVEGEKTTISPQERRGSKVSQVQSNEGFHHNGQFISIDNNTILDATMMKMVLNSMPKLTLSEFELKATVGTGTFGRVRMCKLKKYESSIPLALKIMKKKSIVKLKQVEHVKSEKNILLGVHHPFIVNLFATFQDSKSLFMVMEFVQCGVLFNYLRNEEKFENNRARFYAAEIILALEYLHNREIVYRDLKPENLLIDNEGHIKITDFGFAKVVPDRTWTICGTPEYIAPEVIKSKGHGKSADWWSLGILIFEMLDGSPPFCADDPIAIYMKILAGKINFPQHIDIKAKDLIRRLLSADLSKRFGCMKGGAEDVKKQKWFGSLDWDQCLKRQLEPPFIPETKSPDDTCMFDQYPESTEVSAPIVTPAEQELFTDF